MTLGATSQTFAESFLYRAAQDMRPHLTFPTSGHLTLTTIDLEKYSLLNEATRFPIVSSVNEGWCLRLNNRMFFVHDSPAASAAGDGSATECQIERVVAVIGHPTANATL